MEFVDEKSSKYWKITLDGETTSVRRRRPSPLLVRPRLAKRSPAQVNNGRIGAPMGQDQKPKVHDDAAAARKHYDKMIAAKLKKGYAHAEQP